jgi:uncharacterized membrane protein HdeD (DUF308 family)
VEIFIVRSWKALALRGLAGILFGLAALLWPSITVVALVLLFGAYAMIDGILALAAAGVGTRAPTWTVALEGVLGIGVGLAAFFWTGISALVLVSLIGFWAAVTGILEIALAIRLRREVPGELFLGLSGAVSLLLGIVMFVLPGAGAFAIVWLLGGYAFCFGALTLTLAFRLGLRSTDPHLPGQGAHPLRV